MMNKNEIAAVLEEIGAILEIKGENPFKVRAYANAARVVEGLTEDLDRLIRENRLTEFKGIGKNLAGHITELHQTGKLKEYERIIRQIPEGVLEMLKIPGVGPKTVKTIWEKLKITTIEKLEKACLAGKIAGLEGFGPTSQRKIWEGINQVKKHSGQFLFAVAAAPAQQIFAAVEKHPKVQRAALAGSLRRCKEIVKDIDIVAATKEPKAVMEAFVKLPQVERVVAHGETKSAILLKTGIQADLRCVSDAEFPFALLHFTGSKEHNILMRSRAQARGWKLNEYGLFGKKEKIVPCKDEAQIFLRLGLSEIPPEMREGLGEIELAEKGEIPKLAEEKDIRGVFHCHSTTSDGTATLEQMAAGARRLGFEYYGTGDHSESAHYAGGMDAAKIKKQFAEIDRLNKKLKGLHIFKGMEADILADGGMDMGEKILSQFDYIVASVHSKFNLPQKEMTARMVKAVKNKYVRILGHMTGRLLLSREGYPVDVKQVIDACGDYGTAIEINSNPMRLDIDWRNIPYAREKKVMLVINPDAHSVEGISHFRYGVGIARKGGLTAKEILNTRSCDEVAKWFQHR